MDEVIQTEDFRAFKRRQIGHTLYHDEPFARQSSEADAVFVFPPEIDRQHDLVMSYLHVSSALESMKRTEFYFRRYPFRGLELGRSEHIRTICEMYFSSVYVLKCRIKETLNKLNKYSADRIDVGPFVKRYEKEFSQELRQRNLIHHHSSFDDLGIDKVHLTEVIASSGQKYADGWQREHIAAYRRLSGEWSKRVRRRSGVAEEFVNAVADAMLRAAPFLADLS